MSALSAEPDIAFAPMACLVNDGRGSDRIPWLCAGQAVPAPIMDDVLARLAPIFA